MKKRIIFMVTTLLTCIILFLQRFTAMGIHAIAGLLLLIASMGHTVTYRTVWRKPCTTRKAVELFLWTALSMTTLTGFLLKPFRGEMMVILLHKLSALALVVFLIFHIKLSMPRKKRYKTKS